MGVLAPSGQGCGVGDALGDGPDEGDGGVGAGGGVPEGVVKGLAGPQLPAGVAGGQLGLQVEGPGGELQPGESVGGPDGKHSPAGAVDLPAAVDERYDREERVAALASGVGGGEVGVGALLVRRGERGGEGGDELRRTGVVEADAPGRRAERVLVGVDAPQAVVLAFREVAEADLAVGSIQVGVADYAESALSRLGTLLRISLGCAG